MSSVQIERHERCCVLTLARPEVHNVLDRDMVVDLIAAIKTLEKETAGSSVLVVTGRGDEAFCAGADIKQMADLTDDGLDHFLARTRKLFRTLAEFTGPTIAAVNGYAHGGGAELACACDLRLGTAKSSFRFPGVTYGMAVGTWHLPSLVGLAKAKELLLTGDVVDAEEARRIGLLNRIVKEPLLDTTLELAERIAEHPTETTVDIKSLLNRTVGAPLQQRFYRELYSNRERGVTADVRHRFKRFLEEAAARR